MPPSLRTFLAIPLSDVTREKIFHIQQSLTQIYKDYRWVAQSNLHVTIKFLGQIPTNQLTPIIESITPTLESIKSFWLTIDKPGAFPNNQKAQVIWLGEHSSNEHLIDLVFNLDHRLTDFNIPKESRPWTMHITLGRSRSNNQSRAISLTRPQTTIEPIKEMVNQIVLYKSELTSPQPIYTPLHKWLLK